MYIHTYMRTYIHAYGYRLVDHIHIYTCIQTYLTYMMYIQMYDIGYIYIYIHTCVPMSGLLLLRCLFCCCFVFDTLIVCPFSWCWIILASALANKNIDRVSECWPLCFCTTSTYNAKREGRLSVGMEAVSCRSSWNIQVETRESEKADSLSEWRPPHVRYHCYLPLI